MLTLLVGRLGAIMGYVGKPFLVVDDDADHASAVARVIRHMARRPTEVATSFEHAAKLLERVDPWCGLVLDVVLGPKPTPTGFDLLTRARMRWPGVPALILTGRRDADHPNRTARLRATFVTKPAGVADLTPFVEHALTLDRILNPRLAEAVEETIHALEIGTLKSAKLLRLAATGLDRDTIRAELDVGTDAFAYHVGIILERSGARTLDGLLNEVMRKALGIQS